MEDSSCTIYMKAVDSSVAMGDTDTHSICSTSSGSSFSMSSWGTGYDAYSNSEAHFASSVPCVIGTPYMNGTPYVSGTAIGRTPLSSGGRTPLSSGGRTPLSSGGRTPLSSKARPFISTNFGWNTQGTTPSQVDSEGAQEEINSESDSTAASTCKETLQEDTPLAEDEPKEEAPQEDVTSPKKGKKGKTTQKKGGVWASEPLPVKGTFIHYKENDEIGETSGGLSTFAKKPTCRARSAPRSLTHNNFSALPFSKDMAKGHLMGTCQPCAYFYHKMDGCRWGEDCKYCHLCPEDEIKKRKKQKIKALKQKALDEQGSEEKISTENTENSPVSD